MRPGCWPRAAARRSIANCRGVNLDSTRLKECLSRNQDVCRRNARATIFGVFDAIQKRIAARVDGRQCLRAGDRQALRGSTKETSKSIPCLVDRANGVSRAACRP